jgi:hypothetical protein
LYHVLPRQVPQSSLLLIAMPAHIAVPPSAL